MILMSAELSENREDLYWITNDLIDAIQDLKTLRETFTGNRIPDFDRTLERLLQCVAHPTSKIYLVT